MATTTWRIFVIVAQVLHTRTHARGREPVTDAGEEGCGRACAHTCESRLRKKSHTCAISGLRGSVLGGSWAGPCEVPLGAGWFSWRPSGTRKVSVFRFFALFLPFRPGSGPPPGTKF